MKRYPTYKDSGVEWIGEIPEHWKVKKLKWLAKVRLSNIDKKSKEEEVPVELCNYLDVYYNEKITSAIEFMKATARKEQIDMLSLEKGDVLITKDSETPDDIAVPAFVPSSLSGVVCGYHLTLIRPYHESAYGNYLFRSFSANGIDEQFEASANGITRFGISKHAIANAVFLAPPVSEQQAIANYLDHKTQQIDTLIEKKQKHIALLKEQRTAIINQAVTKGLNPKVRMKDSGIECLGKIPEHWEVKRLKFVSRIKYGLGQPPKEMEGGLPLIRATNIERGRINNKDLLFVDPEDIPYEREPVLRTNDIIVVRSGAYTADSAIIPEEFDGTIAGYDMVVRAHNANSRLIAFILLSNYVLNNQLFLRRLRAAQPHLNAEELGETLILLPPSATEQDDLVRYIEGETSRIDQTISQTEKQIELLNEYRTTLISEVVTGKIDVRDEASL